MHFSRTVKSVTRAPEFLFVPIGHFHIRVESFQIYLHTDLASTWCAAKSQSMHWSWVRKAFQCIKSMSALRFHYTTFQSQRWAVMNVKGLYYCAKVTRIYNADDLWWRKFIFLLKYKPAVRKINKKIVCIITSKSNDAAYW